MYVMQCILDNSNPFIQLCLSLFKICHYMTFTYYMTSIPIWKYKAGNHIRKQTSQQSALLTSLKTVANKDSCVEV